MDFVKSPNFTDTGSSGRKIDLIVVHTMEAAEKGDTAEAIAKFFARSSTKASAHFCVDNDSTVQCVNVNDVAWAAPGANHDGVQIEHAGFARQTSAQWADAYSQRMLARSVQIASELIDRWDIPITWLRAPDLAAGRRGITGHVEVSRAFRLSTHTDPGTAFPIQRYLAAILKHTKGKPTSPKTKVPPPRLKLGDSGWRVKQAQKLLVAANQKLKVDGDYGKWTETAVKAFQKKAGLDSDGTVGPLTWKALWQHYYIVN